ncbi:hypothetical protein Ae201684_016913 [Aphanomyces euteiches]|uniref:Uncharacterized protein n=1 Tax=Aphanomyces euteiches TaxID=100861 RepID=A0A6G0WAI2_9STRA|nr:hypothetical protein Ae201684_016913 [Aphanomyces euteiches]
MFCRLAASSGVFMNLLQDARLDNHNVMNQDERVTLVRFIESTKTFMLTIWRSSFQLSSKDTTFLPSHEEPLVPAIWTVIIQNRHCPQQ